MKTDKAGDAVGRPSWGSSFLGDPGAKFFVENGAHAQNKKKTLKDQEQSERSFYSCFSSLAEPVAAARSGQGCAVFLARRQRTLDGEDRCERIREGGKDLFSRMRFL
jgi:hypothetical protein